MIVNVTKEKGAVEDLELGMDKVIQERGEVTQLHGGHIPYNVSKSVSEELNTKTTIAYVDQEVATREPLGGNSVTPFKASTGIAPDDVVNKAQLDALEDLGYSQTDIDNFLALKAAVANVMALDGTTVSPDYTGALGTVPANKQYVLDTVTNVGAGDMTKAVYDANDNGRIDTTEGVGIPTDSMGITPHNQIMRFSQGTITDANIIGDVGIFKGEDINNAPVAGLVLIEQFMSAGNKVQRCYSVNTNEWYDRFYSDGGVGWTIWSIRTTKDYVDGEVNDLQNLIDGQETRIALNDAKLTGADRVPLDGSQAMTDTLETPAIIMGGNNLTPYAMRNKFINGGFDIWQRGTSFSATSIHTYTADRWNVIGTDVNVTKDDSVVGQGNAIRLQSAIKINNLKQAIELKDNNEFAVGKTFTLSAWLWADSLGDATFTGLFRDAIGSVANEVEVIPVDTFLGALNGWTKVSATFTIPTAQNVSNTQLLVLISPPSGTTIFKLAQVQLEDGTVATPFEQRPIGMELELCKRYYQSHYASSAFIYGVSSAGGYYAGIALAGVTPMRLGIPTFTDIDLVYTNCTLADMLLRLLQGQFQLRVNLDGTGVYRVYGNYSLDAEL